MLTTVLRLAPTKRPEQASGPAYLEIVLEPTRRAISVISGLRDENPIFALLGWCTVARRTAMSALWAGALALPVVA